jgi:hypothetical protein
MLVGSEANTNKGENRRGALKGIAVGLVAGVAAAVSGGRAWAAPQESGSLLPEGAPTLRELTARLEKVPRRRDFKTVPIILNHPKQWDHEALSEVIAYKGEPKQVWDNTDLDGSWLNTMRNSMNTQIWSFRHPDFMCTSATHGSAHLAIFDEAMWDKYQFAKLTNGKYHSNSFVQEPPASRQNPADYEAPDGVFSPLDNGITVLQRRGAVFMACHNEIWELAESLITGGANPDRLSHEALAAELTNHLIPGIVLTPGMGGTLVELQRAGFTYGK